MTDSTQHWTTGTVANWYGERARGVHSPSATAVWSHAGKPVVPSRWVLIRAPAGRFEPQAWLTTHQQLAPAQILTSCIRRWPMEATVEDARAHLGVEPQRQWRQNATARPSPAWLARSSIVTLIAAHRLGTNTMPGCTVAWSRKEAATFSDTSAVVRRWLWCQNHFSMSEAGTDSVKIPRSLFERFPMPWAMRREWTKSS